MFEAKAKPRIFACPPGADFPQLLVEGIRARTAKLPPAALARVRIYVNTRRMQRRVQTLFEDGGAALMPRIHLITDLARDPSLQDGVPPVSALRRRLELSQLISGLLDRQPDLAPRSALFDLADSLARLMAEMHDEGVPPGVLRALDVSDRSGYWQRSQLFLDLVETYFGPEGQETPDDTARLRQAVEGLIAVWEQRPPSDPIIVAGSTGSRGTTAMLIRAVSRLPQGAVVLPGFDMAASAAIWDRMCTSPPSEDHPQYRYVDLLQKLDLSRDDVTPWLARDMAPSPARNALISLALRPAPVTDQWREEGARLADIGKAAQGMTLIEAANGRKEAVAIALILRRAAAEGRSAALVTPDQTLTRRVTAALDRWGIEPDVSAGEPLTQTPPGRLMCQVAELVGRPITPVTLLAILKHPLVHFGGDARGPHQAWTRELEHHLRKTQIAFPTALTLATWAADGADVAGRIAWAGWLSGLLCPLEAVASQPMETHLKLVLSVAEDLANGPGFTGPCPLWDKTAGQRARSVIAELAEAAPYGGTLSASDFATLFTAILKQTEVRDPLRPHPDIMIWGTLEARVQGADIVVLGGLNEGVWPEVPPPDPWLNRRMRVDAGLLLPERKVGLSAHDFQQSIGAREVVLSRALRDDEADTVPSRWLNRLVNLMTGLSDTSRAALAGMRERGADWLDLLDQVETPVPVTPAHRPSPRPPVEVRPKELSVTDITKLIRDPYAIYAKSVLGLRRLNPLEPLPDGRMRGNVLHDIMEHFVKALPPGASANEAQRVLETVAANIMDVAVPWPGTRLHWLERLKSVASALAANEVLRRADVTSVWTEVWGRMALPEVGFEIYGKADRIDLGGDGRLTVYDYKSGPIPAPKVVTHFERQLPLESMMAAHGAFEGVPALPVAGYGFIGLGASGKDAFQALSPSDTDRVRAELVELIRQRQMPENGFTARRAMQTVRFSSDYEHLARYGEWDDSSPPVPEQVG